MGRGASTAHKLDRVRKPRVQITYDVHIGEAVEMKDLPFVVGVMADLSGQPKEPLRKLSERSFVEIDRDNINEVLAAANPRVALKVPNRLANDDTKMAVEVNFKSMDDFEPARVAEQIPALKELLDMRKRLEQLMTKIEGNDKAEAILDQLLSDHEKAKTLAQGSSQAAPDAPKPEENT